ncbi:hypothetical protein GGH19_000357 [Coemansia sp. RSA 1807]|nr:hypothetical protein EV180_003953 [Coemansia sp. RSA 518]KAJ2578536.1 hypothetical protein GGH19_000357 [Coemansia sp. RSA 1807]
MATQSLLDEIQQLLDSELCESALQLAELECKPRLHDPHVPIPERLALLRTYSRCHSSLNQHSASLHAITEFVSGPTRAQLSSEDLEQIVRDISDARWALGEHDLCLAQLRQIPRRHRTVRDVARMARCAELVHSSDARDLYKELLVRQPNATEAYAFVHSRGAGAPFDGSTRHDVASITMARTMMRRLEYKAAASELQRLARRHRSNAHVVALHATCLFMLDDVRQSRILYERARALDPMLMHEMGAYSALLMQENDAHAVYALGSQLLRTDQMRPEGWTAMARFLAMTGQTQEALALVWKAQALAPSCAAAYCAEGGIQLLCECPEEAAKMYAKAHALEPTAQTYRGLITSYVQNGEHKFAYSYAKQLVELMPQNARALAAVGSVLAHSAESHAKAVRLLESALAQDPRCTDAIVALASLHVTNNRLSDAVSLLERHLVENETDDMYTRYADVLTLANELPKAAANYAVALEMNPSNERAKTGYERVDRLMHPSAESDDGEPGEGEPEVEPSDMSDDDML